MMKNTFVILFFGLLLFSCSKVNNNRIEGDYIGDFTFENNSFSVSAHIKVLNKSTLQINNSLFSLNKRKGTFEGDYFINNQIKYVHQLKGDIIKESKKYTLKGTVLVPNYFGNNLNGTFIFKQI